jgi:hypothetical protein
MGKPYKSLQESLRKQHTLGEYKVLDSGSFIGDDLFSEMEGV